ncbi:MAG: hypothetical protein A2086_00320 [Spirochaetes bacterium GWD1_27_9]|nr:MAG: hypothetical protein A2Z98_18505 [Spirochaetes bacterium GWB1_27_13]OHD23391.1 MAG: hypothetical protein A2Y34_18705 [Spirochaetes bacterium GWC1_27_15]OHD43015.1 MAG: hypothetical protein A2086_00320 [Spirochaetes bacterium GWD1_27_9]
MERQEINKIWLNFNKIMSKLPTPGVLVVTGNRKDKENIITIGWMQFGFLWQEPSVSILVRPSRHSHKLLQKYPEFTVNILPLQFSEQIAFCGTNSGAYCDKFAETKLTKINSKEIGVSSIKEAEISLECKLVHTNNIIPENLNDVYLAKYYGSGDYHSIFTGTILNYRENFN